MEIHTWLCMWFETDTVFILRRYVLKCLENKVSCLHLLSNILTTKKGMYVFGGRKTGGGGKEGGRGGEGKEKD